MSFSAVWANQEQICHLVRSCVNLSSRAQRRETWGGSISLISLFTCFLHIVEDMLAAISSDSNIINSVPSNCGSVLVSTTNNYLKISSPIPHYDPRLHPTQKQTHSLSLCTCEDICFTAALENKYMIKIAIKQQLCRLCTRVIPTFGGVVYSPHESCSVV